MRYIDRSNDDNNNNKEIQSNSWIWLIAYMAVGLAISSVVPFPISIVMALLVFFLLNAVRMHIALKGARDSRWNQGTVQINIKVI